MPELWVNIVIVLLLSTCVVGMLWSGMRILRLRRERQQHVEVVQSRMSARVSARSATLPAVHAVVRPPQPPLAKSDFGYLGPSYPASVLAWSGRSHTRVTISPA